MSREMFKPWKPKGIQLRMVEAINLVLAAYIPLGITPTLRQLYYRLVAAGTIQNNHKMYKYLGRVVTQGRLAGMIDWDHIEDRHRSLAGVPHYNGPAHRIRTAARNYAEDSWSNQPQRFEVWMEKDALSSVLELVCPQLDVDFFVCKGYTSISEMRQAARRLGRYIDAGQEVTILHLGDHDPSGIDMTRDIIDRMALFLRVDPEEIGLERLALNMDQVRKYNPPPNPTKPKDARTPAYRAAHGHSCWELDALDPMDMVEIIRAPILAARDEDLYQEHLAHQEANRERVRLVAELTDAVMGVAEDRDEEPDTLLTNLATHAGDLVPVLEGDLSSYLDDLGERPQDVVAFLRTGFDAAAVTALDEMSPRIFAALETGLEEEDFTRIKDHPHGQALVKAVAQSQVDPETLDRVLANTPQVMAYLAFLDRINRAD
jgi:hypothetical protein